MRKRLLAVFLILALTAALLPATAVSADAAGGTLRITAQPRDVTAQEGATVSFSVTAAGDGLSYKWQYSANEGASWVNCSSAGYNTPVFSFRAAQRFDGRRFRCMVSNPDGSVTSEAAKLTIDNRALITAQPKDVTAQEGVSVSFSVTAVGNDLSYQWQYSANGGKSWVNCSSAGANTSVFAFRTAQRFHERLFRCVVSNPYGSVTSEAAKLTIDNRPVITAQPKDVLARVGVSVSFSVTAAGEDLSYQWQYSANEGASWVNCSSAGYDTAVFSFRAAQRFDGRRFRCVVSNPYGSVVSKAAKLTIDNRPPFSETPAAASARVSIDGTRLPKVYGSTASVSADQALVRDEDLSLIWPGTTWTTFITPEFRYGCTVAVNGTTFTFENGKNDARYDGTHWYLPCRKIPLALGYSEYMDTVANLATYTILPDVSRIPSGRSVPVMMYHAVGDTPFAGGITELFVKPANLEAQLQYIKNNGYSAIWFEDLPNLANYSKPVILTFDDGYRDNYTLLFPLLKKYNIKATIFIFPYTIGTNKNFLTWDMVKEMSDSGLVSFQSHTMSHSDLDQLDEETQRWELAESQRVITAKTGKQCCVLCFPTGKYNSTTLKLAQQYYLFSIKMNGNLYVTGTNRYLIPRYYVSRDTTLASFAAMIRH